MTSTMTIDRAGNKIWRNQEGQFHRTDGPAYERANGRKSWFLNGQLHRTDGPAVEKANSFKQWWVDDQQLTFTEWAERVANTEQERTLLMIKYGGVTA
jgi:hypothetical protein